MNRNFLLFIPASNASLRAVLSYYSSTATMNQEGDVHINDATQGIGMSPVSIHIFIQVSATRACPELFTPSLAIPLRCFHCQESVSRTLCQPVLPHSPTIEIDVDSALPHNDDRETQSHALPTQRIATQGNTVLTCTNNVIGYFAAGGLAGMISRTATAPLDRLKVYLIAQTGTKEKAVDLVKNGSPVKAARHFGAPLVQATKELWRAGGVRSLFAGIHVGVIVGGTIIDWRQAMD